MLWLLIGTAILALLLLSLRAFERASVATIYALFKWIAAFGGIALTLLLFLSGRGPSALAGLVMVAPLLWRRWHPGRVQEALPVHRRRGVGGNANAPPRRQGSSMTRAEA